MKALPLLLVSFFTVTLYAEIIEADVVIYGGTASGVAAGCTAARLGKTEIGRAHV